ncbi:MAG: ferredoxin, partial [Ectothiorhodospiraceae bacterium]|nr:ferredoxin [Ectothiorhodospiraceae bacterium]
MKHPEYLFVDGAPVKIEGERNVLELVRKAGVDIPTFCYHSELSVYGACRLCMVDVENEGVKASCSLPPRDGMHIKTSTAEIREMRKISVELLLANHKMDCPTCPRISECKLKNIAKRLGVKDIRFKRTETEIPIDDSSPSLLRDPNKCILCGDCVRMCKEIQDIGAIDFVHRGAEVQVLPAFGKDLASVECVNCGQCSRVCPTGALTPRSEVDGVWDAIYNEEKIVVVQIAPAVRVSIGEMFGMKPGTVVTGKLVAALKQLGFNKVYDTSFAADLT